MQHDNQLNMAKLPVIQTEVVALFILLVAIALVA
tara:strand:+ start:42522 stop:42623 length:102 start_codon:yes stop_codon:yes gene_type:complete